MSVMTKTAEPEISTKKALTKKEKEKILYGFNKTTMEYPQNLTVVDLFEKQVELNPDKIAVVHKYSHLTYRQLNEKANQLARLLRQKGVKEDSAAGIIVDRSMDMIISCMAVLKAGGGYLPIETSYPEERIQYILENSNAPVLLTQKHLLDKVKFNGEVINLDDEGIYSGNKENLEHISGPENLSYIIYTSGSTGKPKGVMIEHKALSNMCAWHKQSVNLTKDDNVSKNAAFGFDASVLEIFPTLITGASIYIIPEEIKLSPKDLNEYFEANNITMCFYTTLFGEQFMDMVDNHSLKYMIVGGEKLKTFKPRNYKLLNIYGPTEYTVYTTSYVVEKDEDNIPIGKPVGNTRIYVLDDNDNIVPVGEQGELCMSGNGLARGYLNNQELTDKRFVENPFEPGNKMYRTGDLVRWLPDGKIEYVGRKDFQIKLRGYRIELPEIEQHILKYQSVKEVIVVDKDDIKGNKFLCGYFVAAEEVNIQDLKAFISKSLPDYMVPSFFMQLDKMPLTPNGKIDRKALPEPEGVTYTSTKYVAPEGDVEKAMAEIWEEVLGFENISVEDNFFSIGGHSLKAVFLQSKIEKQFDVNISLNDIFKYPTIRELSNYMPGLMKTEYKKIQPLNKRKYYELSSSQKRLYFIEQMPEIGTTYNVPIILEIKGSLDVTKLSESIDKLVERHEALRTSFNVVDGQPVQKVHDDFHLKKIFRNATEKEIPPIIERFIRPFDLSKAPLFRVELISIDDTKHMLLMDFHHIIIDGVSVVNIIHDLVNFYKGNKPETLEIQYKDFAEWQNKLLSSDDIKEQEKYWLDTFSGDIPVLEMPTDYPNPSVLDYIGDEITVKLNKRLTKSLYDFCAQSRTTLFMILMSAYNVLLHKYTSQEDIIVGSPIAGRSHSDLQDVVGMFVNTIPIRSYPASEKLFTEFLSEINENCLQAFENQDYQLDTLIDKLNIKRDSSKHPLFDVAMVLQNMGIQETQSEDIIFKPVDLKKKDAKFDLLLEILEKPDTLVLNWNFRKSLFNKETIERMATHFTNLLNTIIEKPDQMIKDLNILSKEEELQLLFDFNDTHVEYPHNINIHQMFEEQVRQYPDNVAVVFEDQFLTYRELNKKSNQLAHYLRNKGVKTDTIIGLMLDRSVNMLIGILGILKAGGCYLPINPDYPEERTNYILENSEAPLLITTANYLDSVKLNGEKIDIEDRNIYTLSTDNPENINDPEDLAYIIYTSGSTGKPKGVMIQHKNVIRLLKNDKNLYDFCDTDVWTMFHSFCFDFSVWEIYGAILFGGKLIIVPKNATLSPHEFLKLLKKEKATVLNQTPGAFYNLIEEDLKSEDRDLNIRYVIFGGEALKPLMLKTWHEKYPQTKLINMYGITETTVHVTYKEITDHEINNNISNIGVPIPTLTTYIMDKNSKLVPIGVVGEICVGGDGVARGYVNKPELTAKRFIENPYPPHDRIYRSGDLAKLLPNGEMVYYGRMDFQVKIRGFRIELAEIEDKLLKLPDVKKGIVLAREDSDGSMVLVAYLVMDKELSVKAFRDYLSQDLPDYMIPSYFVKMDELPLTVNKKVDRKALPDPTKSIDTGTKYVAPENELQKQVVEIWQKVLGVEKIGINDNFFSLGGHSLKAVTLVAELQKYFNVSVNDVFEHQTVSELSDVITPVTDNIKIKLQKLKDRISDIIGEKDHDVMKNPEIENLLNQYKKNNERYNTLDLTRAVKYENILLTGVTGYLGAHLLIGLMETTSANVHCMVRAKNSDEATKRVIKKISYYFGEEKYNRLKDRIIVVQSELSEDKLGLSDDLYDTLSNKIDCIIHSAAIVRHYGHYQDFYNSNVQATLNLLEFASKNKIKDFNHISTTSVAMGKITGKENALFTEYDCDLGQQEDNYYVKTKFEAEKHVIKARENAINTNIYRIGNITFNSESSVLQDNITENAFFSTVKSFVNIGIIPDRADEVELSFVDQVTKSILLLFDKVELMNETYHIQNTHNVKLSDILTSESLKLNIDRVSFENFIEYLNENYDKKALRTHIENILLHRGWLSEDDDQTNFIICMDKTEQILEKLNFKWKEVPGEQLNNLIIKALEERMDFLHEVPIFKVLQKDILESLAKLSRELVYDMDVNISFEDKPTKNLYIVKDGYIELYRHSKSGWLGTVMLLSEGEFFDENIFREDEVSTLSAQVVLDDATVLLIKDSDIIDLIKKSPEFSLSFLSALSDRIRKLEKMIIDIG